MKYWVCSQCHLSKPVTTEFWNADGDSFHRPCKSCRNYKKRKNRESEQMKEQQQDFETKQMILHEQHVLEQQKEFEDKRFAILQAGLRKMQLDILERYSISPGTAVPHTAELVEAITEALGGPRGSAAQLAALLYDPDTGSKEKLRIMELYARLVSTNTEQGGARKPTHLLEDEDLERELRRLQTEDMRRTSQEVVPGV